MKPPPQRADDDDARAARGRTLFNSNQVGCASCHMGGGTDNLSHDIGSVVRGDNGIYVDTPSLRFVGGTPPYFHDGRYGTLPALLRDADSGGRVHMGRTRHLSCDDI